MAQHHRRPPPPSTHEPATSSILQSSFHNLTLDHTLEDLSARFIVNLPAEELESMDRVCFQIEQAHWYYEDFIRPAALNPGLLPSYGLKAFSLLMFRSCPLLHDLLPNHGKIWNSFMAYKERVPVCGAIIISEHWDKVLLVKGWAKGSSWSFPRGKINKEEPEALCAVREVLEETGFDLSDYFHPLQFEHGYVEDEGAERIPYYVELVIKEQKIRLYFIPGVKETTKFETRTRKEISKIDWFKLNDLPTWSKDKKGRTTRTKAQLEGKQAKFYMVTPFISHLKLWIEHHKPKNLPPRNRDVSPRIPLVSPPRSPLVNDHSLSSSYPSYHFDDATSHLPSEAELGDSTSAEADSTEDEEDDLNEPNETVTFETAEQGTEALTAFFFGSPPAAPSEPLPLSPPSRSASFEVASTPPHTLYERQSSFLQPKPQPSNQQSKLLELLSGAVPSPPPPASARTGHYASASPPEPARTEPTSILHLLNNVQIADPTLTSHESTPHYAQSPVDSPALPHSILFSGSQAPPEAADFGRPLPAHLAANRDDAERKEKHSALLRAMFNVGNGPARSGLYEDELAIRSDGRGDSSNMGTRAEIQQFLNAQPRGSIPTGTVPEDSDRRWNEQPASRSHQFPTRDETYHLPAGGTPHIHSVSHPPAYAPTATDAYFSPAADRQASLPQPLPAQTHSLPAPPRTGGGSLLSILNGTGGERAAPDHLTSPSTHSHSSSAHHPIPNVESSEGKDSLQMLKEYRARQLGPDAVSSVDRTFSLQAEPVPPIRKLDQIPSVEPNFVRGRAYETGSAPSTLELQQTGYPSSSSMPAPPVSQPPPPSLGYLPPAPQAFAPSYPPSQYPTASQAPAFTHAPLVPSQPPQGFAPPPSLPGYVQPLPVQPPQQPLHRSPHQSDPLAPHPPPPQASSHFQPAFANGSLPPPHAATAPFNPSSTHSLSAPQMPYPAAVPLQGAGQALPTSLPPPPPAPAATMGYGTVNGNGNGNTMGGQGRGNAGALLGLLNGKL
ncbi:hypothetical protein JCM10212_004504 [Sporobolomyces blumeae]